jgi:hypothetical protein
VVAVLVVVVQADIIAASVREGVVVVAASPGAAGVDGDRAADGLLQRLQGRAEVEVIVGLVVTVGVVLALEVQGVRAECGVGAAVDRVVIVYRPARFF